MKKSNSQPVRYLFLFTIFSLVFVLSGQAQTHISGTINSYTKVTSVDATDQVTVSNAAAFAVGDTVLIIQMKGIEINVNDDPAQFGLKQNTYSAGKYEFLIIANITGNQVTFTADLTWIYEPAGMVQLIRVPGYDNALVTSDITCVPWDSLNGYGGVIAMFVGNTLTLNADIDVSGCGFEGGNSVVLSPVECIGNTKVYYSVSMDSAGFKGEGSASFSFPGASLLDTTYLKGRGRYFNGGGGGNGKYSGGGGGGNGGSGGDGGWESETCGINIIGGIGGFDIGSSIITYKTDKRIFLGGGGGAGTQGSPGEGTDGGNGGGIVIIVADKLVGNGYNIKANGESVTMMATGDGGGGGGGAGGTILLEIAGYKGSNLTVEAMGGTGGSTSNVSPDCTGPGGGGGGGIFWHSIAALPPELTVDLNRGNAGMAPCGLFGQSNGIVGETTDGLIVPLNGFLFNSIFSSVTGELTDTICEGDIPPPILGTQPKGGTGPGTYTYTWEYSENKIDWNFLAGEISKDYTPANPLIDTTYYRRTVTDASGTPIVDVSKVLTIIVQPEIIDNVFSIDDTICYGQIPAQLESDFPEPSGGDGPGSYTYYWQDSIAGGTWDTIPAATGDKYQSPALTETTWFRRIVQSGIGCPDTSNFSKMTVLPLISNNTITADQVICEGVEFDPLDGTDLPVLSGGNTPLADYRFQWIESTDGSTWNGAFGPNTNKDYSPDTTSATFPSTDTVYFGRIVISGPLDVCIDTSTVVKLVQWPKIITNTIITDQVICEGDDPVLVPGSDPAGGDGTNYLYQWQEHNGTWGDIAGETARDYDPGILNDTMLYRRIVSSDVVCRDTSNVDTIPVNPAIVNFDIQTISGATDTIVCNGQVPNDLVPEPTSIVGGDGTYTYVWEVSTDGGSIWTTTGGITSDLAPGVLTETSIFRRTVTSGACTQLSNEITITVLPLISGNTMPANSTICYNTTITLTTADPAGGDGSYIYYWEESPDNVAWGPASGTGDQRDYTSPQLTSETYYRRTVTSGLSGCCQDISAPVKISIYPLPTAVITSIDTVICNGSNAVLTFTVGGNTNWPYTLTFDDGFGNPDVKIIDDNIPDTKTISPTSDAEFTQYIYRITNVTDDMGCIADTASLTGLAKVRVDGNPVSNPGPNDSICGPTYTLQAVPDTIGTGSWILPPSVVDAANITDPNKEVTVDSYGDHIFIWVVDNGTCTGNSDSVKITFYEAPTPADAGPDTTLLPLTTEINLSGNTPVVGTGTWTKLPSDAQAVIVDPSDPTTLVTDLTDQAINKFIWTIRNGVCPEESDEVLVDVVLFKIPTGFSPNGDDINDYYVISGAERYENELIILNRNGLEVFRAVNYLNDWDGKYASGDDTPDDTYFYIFYYTKEDGTKYEQSGWLVIKR